MQTKMIQSEGPILQAFKIKKTFSGQAAIKKKKWKYKEDMSFLLDYLQERNTMSNVSEEMRRWSSRSREQYRTEISRTIRRD
jgi:hypothetical protein